MEHTLIRPFGGISSLRRAQSRVDDPLDPIRGILVGIALSVLGFWLPVALLVSQ